ncbi:hypothetical protein FA95DRAFT_1563378 [Auriscalpium vulgare]|uniref:Uncharacterized protein n=1 Tax=Auriscalpium vulgare TaxID=40419 RepID=A0ACB8RHQ8_9AGAM|nr:hypothetical protein FA95DRAFT_1563378 [Auriscalpium vulgare]
MPLSNDMAALIGFACETLLYGAYCILFIVALTLIFWGRRKREANIPIMVASVFLFLICTTHFAIEFNHFYVTLGRNGVVKGYANETSPLFGADLLISIADLVGDTILLYRCYLIYGKNIYIVIIPFLTALGGLACICAVVHEVLAISPTAPVAPSNLVPLGIAGYTLPLCTNVIVTALIVGRIWYLTPRTQSEWGVTSSTTAMGHKAMEIIIESGALYLIVQAILVATFTKEVPSQAILAVIAVQIYGIAPTLIMIRVGMGLSTMNTPGRYSDPNISWNSKPPSQLRVGYSTTAFTDGSTNPAADIDLKAMRSDSFSRTQGVKSDEGSSLHGSEFAIRAAV